MNTPNWTAENSRSLIRVNCLGKPITRRGNNRYIRRMVSKGAGIGEILSPVYFLKNIPTGSTTDFISSLKLKSVAEAVRLSTGIEERLIR